ncbi:hypothetical protein QZH41_002896 [Actinostola sp. cb2023]|nr:hypothetical protein QZH41_002896 [Actinostola sp. cb2023]
MIWLMILKMRRSFVLPKNELYPKSRQRSKLRGGRLYRVRPRVFNVRRFRLSPLMLFLILLCLSSSHFVSNVKQTKVISVFPVDNVATGLTPVSSLVHSTGPFVQASPQAPAQAIPHPKHVAALQRLDEDEYDLELNVSCNDNELDNTVLDTSYAEYLEGSDSVIVKGRLRAILELVELGSVIECPCPPYVVNPLSVSIQSSVKKRLILDLRHVNFFVKKSKIKFEDASSMLTKTREVLVDCYMTDIISDEEFVLLYDASYSKNLELPYDDYGRFDLEEMADSECIAEFRVKKRDLPLLADMLQIPDSFVCDQGSVSEGMEGLSGMLLRRLSYPCRYSDMIPRFARPTPVLSMVTNKALDFIYDEHSHRIMDWNHDILDPAHLQTYANVPFMQREQHLIIASVSSMELLDQSRDQTSIKDLFTMDTKGYMPLNFSLWPYQMELLATCMGLLCLLSTMAISVFFFC